MTSNEYGHDRFTNDDRRGICGTGMVWESRKKGQAMTPTERAMGILKLIDAEPSEWCPECDGQGEIDDGKCGRCGMFGCRTTTCTVCNGEKMKPIDRVGIIATALTIPSGHVRLPDGRDVKISEAGMMVLLAIADGNPLGAYVTAGILDWPRTGERK